MLLNLLVSGGSVKLTEGSLSMASIFDESMVLAWREIKDVCDYHLLFVQKPGYAQCPARGGNTALPC